MSNNLYSADFELDSNQYASIADGSQTGLDVATDLSGEAWIKLEQLASVAGTNQQIFSKYEQTLSQRAYEFYVDTNDVLKIDVSDDGTSNATHIVDIVSTTTIAALTWYHVAFAFDISAETCQFYISTQDAFDVSGEAGTKNGSMGANIHNSTAAFVIGASLDNGSPIQYFDGKINNCRVFSDLRTAGEIAANWKRVLTSANNLQGSWYAPANDHVDLTTNNNDLTASGSPTFVTDVPFKVGGGFLNLI